MTSTQATPVAATPTPQVRRAATAFDTNPSKAGWFTKIVRNHASSSASVRPRNWSRFS